MRQRASGTFVDSKRRIVSLVTALLGIALLWYSAAPGTHIVPIASAQTTGHAPYTTKFPGTENPISENNNWINGGVAGNWGSVRETPGLAFGASIPNQYGDPTAVLSGTWGTTQTATGVVKVLSNPGDIAEVELRVRTKISANSITGYELLCSVWPQSSYGMQLVRWNGPNASFAILASNSTRCANGDTLKIKVSGTIANVWLNDKPLTFNREDNGQNQVNIELGSNAFQNGSPGIGFYRTTNSGWSNFGFSSFSASDGSTTQPPEPPGNLTLTVN